MTIFIISAQGEKLMPTFNIKKIRKLLKAGNAKIIKHDPFTVQLLYETGNDTQPVEFKEDTGYQYIGVSLASEKHEYVSAEYKLLENEKQRHDKNRQVAPGPDTRRGPCAAWEEPLYRFSHGEECRQE